jgi:hypothetical protein
MRLALILAMGLPLFGCILHAHRHPRHGEPVVVDHVHTDHCGHYYWRGRWYYAERHAHGPGCGHTWVQERWTYIEDDGDRDGEVRHVVVDRGHVCSDPCDHYCDDDGRWIVVRGHRHGPGCGHHLVSGRWVVTRVVVLDHGHRCHDRCDHYWHGGRWHVIRGHAHRHGCGHHWDGARWVVR